MNMNANAQTSTLLFPNIKPKWQRSFQSTDIEPSPFDLIAEEKSVISSISPSRNTHTVQKADGSDATGSIESFSRPLLSSSSIGPLSINHDSPMVGIGTKILCPTCRRHEARYTCPRCHAPYCSIACYKIHDIPSSSPSTVAKTPGHTDDNDDSNNVHSDDYTQTNSGGGRCTEAFYREKIRQVTDLYVKEDQRDGTMLGILSRAHQDMDMKEGQQGKAHWQEQESESEFQNAAKHGHERIMLTDEELLELAECGLSLADGHLDRGIKKNQEGSEFPGGSSTVSIGVDSDTAHEEDDESFFLKLPLHLRTKFEFAVERGELSHLLSGAMGSPFDISSAASAAVLRPVSTSYDKDQHEVSESATATVTWGEGHRHFSPFWLPQYCSPNRNHHEQVKVHVQNEELDSAWEERILGIPPLILRGARDTKGKQTSLAGAVALHHNICELMYVSAWTLRLYHYHHTTSNAVDVSPHGHHKSHSVHQCQSSIVVEMALFLYRHSHVLSHDRRYECLPEVFMECSARTHQNNLDQHGIATGLGGGGGADRNGDGNDIIHWHMLVLDVIHICRYRRVVLRILITVMDILVDAKKELKCNPKKCQYVIDSGISNGDSRMSYKTIKKQLILATKKIEYFAAWCQANWETNNIAKSMVHEAEIWLKDWGQGSIIQLKDSWKESSEGITISDFVFLGNVKDGVQGWGMRDSERRRDDDHSSFFLSPRYQRNLENKTGCKTQTY